MSNHNSQTSPKNSYELTRCNINILGTIPERWGRMDISSQATLIEAGKILRRRALTSDRQYTVSSNFIVGFIGGSRRGSLASDLIYGDTMSENAMFASPALFSYTLPNIPLSEAAIHFKLIGPVFAIISQNPYQEAVITAKQWLTSNPKIYGFIAGEAECRREKTNNIVTIRLTFVGKES